MKFINKRIKKKLPNEATSQNWIWIQKKKKIDIINEDNCFKMHFYTHRLESTYKLNL